MKSEKNLLVVFLERNELFFFLSVCQFKGAKYEIRSRLHHIFFFKCIHVQVNRICRKTNHIRTPVKVIEND